MLNLTKTPQFKIIAITVAMTLFFESTVYGTDLCDVRHLRVPMASCIERMGKINGIQAGGQVPAQSGNRSQPKREPVSDENEERAREIEEWIGSPRGRGFQKEIREPKEGKIESVKVYTVDGRLEEHRIKTIRRIGAGLGQVVYEKEDMDTGQRFVEKYAGKLELYSGSKKSAKWLIGFIYKGTRQALPSYQVNFWATLSAMYADKVIADAFELEYSHAIFPKPLYVRYDEGTRGYVKAYEFKQGRGIKPTPANEARSLIPIMRVWHRFLSKRLGFWGLARQIDILHNPNALSNIYIGPAGEVGGYDTVPYVPGGLFFLMPWELNYTLKGVWKGEFPPFGDAIDFEALDEFVSENGTVAMRRDVKWLRFFTRRWKSSEPMLFSSPIRWWHLLFNRRLKRNLREALITNRLEYEGRISSETAKQYRDALKEKDKFPKMRRHALLSLTPVVVHRMLTDKWYLVNLIGRFGIMPVNFIGYFISKPYRQAIWRRFVERRISHWAGRWAYKVEALSKSDAEKQLNDFFYSKGKGTIVTGLSQHLFLLGNIMPGRIGVGFQRFVADPEYRKVTLWKFLFGIGSTNYRIKFSKDIIGKWVDEARIEGWLSKEEAEAIYEALDSPDNQTLLGLFGAHILLRGFKVPSAGVINIGLLITAILTGKWWLIACIFFDGAMRTLATLILTGFKYKTALLLGWIPTLGSVAILMDTYPELSKFLFRKIASVIARKIPGLGERSSLTEVVLVGTTNIPIWLLSKFVKASHKVESARFAKALLFPLWPALWFLNGVHKVISVCWILTKLRLREANKLFAHEWYGKKVKKAKEIFEQVMLEQRVMPELPDVDLAEVKPALESYSRYVEKVRPKKERLHSVNNLLDKTFAQVSKYLDSVEERHGNDPFKLILFKPVFFIPFFLLLLNQFLLKSLLPQVAFLHNYFNPLMSSIVVSLFVLEMFRIFLPERIFTKIMHNNLVYVGTLFIIFAIGSILSEGIEPMFNNWGKDSLHYYPESFSFSSLYKKVVGDWLDVLAHFVGICYTGIVFRLFLRNKLGKDLAEPHSAHKTSAGRRLFKYLFLCGAVLFMALVPVAPAVAEGFMKLPQSSYILGLFGAAAVIGVAALITFIFSLMKSASHSDDHIEAMLSEVEKPVSDWWKKIDIEAAIRFLEPELVDFVEDIKCVPRPLFFANGECLWLARIGDKGAAVLFANPQGNGETLNRPEQILKGEEIVNYIEMHAVRDGELPKLIEYAEQLTPKSEEEKGISVYTRNRLKRQGVEVSFSISQEDSKDIMLGLDKIVVPHAREGLSLGVVVDGLKQGSYKIGAIIDRDGNKEAVAGIEKSMKIEVRRGDRFWLLITDKANDKELYWGKPLTVVSQADMERVEDWSTRIPYYLYQQRYLSWRLAGKMVIATLERMYRGLIYKNNHKIGYVVKDLSEIGIQGLLAVKDDLPWWKRTKDNKLLDICVLSHRYDTLGGLEIYLRTLYEQIAKIGNIRVHMVYFTEGRKSKGSIIPFGPGEMVLHPIYIPIRAHPYISFKNMSFLIRELADIKRKEKIDLLHLHYPYYPILIISHIFLSLAGMPLVTTCHGTLKWSLSWKHSGLKIFLKFMQPLLGKKLGVSNISASTLGKKAEVIGSFVDTSLFAPEKANPQAFLKVNELAGVHIIFYPSRITPMKGQLDLVEVARNINKKRPNLHFKIIILGPSKDDSYLEKIRDKILSYQLEDYIMVLPPLQHDELPDAIASADIIAVPSYSEGLSLTALEALSMKKPVVANKVGGVPEVVIDGETGFLVEPHNTEEMADRIIYLLDHPEVRQEMGEKGREFVMKNYSVEGLVERHLELYSQFTKRELHTGI